MSQYQIRRGDIFYVYKAGEQTGSEQYSGRPAVVVSNDKNNEYSPTVEIVYCTTKPKEDLPTHCLIRSTSVASTVLGEQIMTVDKSRLGDYIGSCNEVEMTMINTILAVSLALDEVFGMVQKVAGGGTPVCKPVKEDSTPVEEYKLRDDVLIELKTERDTYKTLYEGLLARVIPAGK